MSPSEITELRKKITVAPNVKALRKIARQHDLFSGRSKYSSRLALKVFMYQRVVDKTDELYPGLIPV